MPPIVRYTIHEARGIKFPNIISASWPQTQEYEIFLEIEVHRTSQTLEGGVWGIVG